MAYASACLKSQLAKMKIEAGQMSSRPVSSDNQTGVSEDFPLISLPVDTQLRNSNQLDVGQSNIPSENNQLQSMVCSSSIEQEMNSEFYFPSTIPKPESGPSTIPKPESGPSTIPKPESNQIPESGPSTIPKPNTTGWQGTDQQVSEVIQLVKTILPNLVGRFAYRFPEASLEILYAEKDWIFTFLSNLTPNPCDLKRIISDEELLTNLMKNRYLIENMINLKINSHLSNLHPEAWSILLKYRNFLIIYWDEEWLQPVIEYLFKIKSNIELKDIFKAICSSPLAILRIRKMNFTNLSSYIELFSDLENIKDLQVNGGKIYAEFVQKSDK
jgi:hypothetical protein